MIKTNADEFWNVARKHVRKTSTVLDIGCGIRPQSFFEPDLHICLDPHDEYLDYLGKNLSQEKLRHILTLVGDWTLAPNIFSAKSVDSLFLLDVIEHVDKQLATQLLKQCESIVREQIVIFTPLGFLPQEMEEDGIDGWGMHGAQWQVHRSGWTPDDFDARWEFVVCENFHKVDGKGHPLDHAYGAFFAILNLEQTKKKGFKELRKTGFMKAEMALASVGL